MDQRASKTGGQAVHARKAVRAAGNSARSTGALPPRPTAAAKAANAKSVHPTRELPAPTPLVLPTRPTADYPAVAGKVQTQPSPAKVSKAPPPPRRRPASSQAPVGQFSAGQLIPPEAAHTEEQLDEAQLNQHWTQYADAQWAQHLAPQSSPGSQIPSVPASSDSTTQMAPDSQPPAGASNLLDLESEISALRPRPSEVPPAPASHSERVPANRRRDSKNFRTKTPSDLSVLFQASAVNSPVAKRAEVGPRPLVQPGSRGYLPKSPLEFLPPPPPPTRRAQERDFGAEDSNDDEMPTQARRPASVPPIARVPNHRSAIVPPPAPTAPPVAERAGARFPTSLPAAAFGGALPQLPPPPALPTGMDRKGSTSFESWDGQEWTGANGELRTPHLRDGLPGDAQTPSAPPLALNDHPGFAHADSSRPGATTNAHVHQYVSPDSVHPTVLSVPPGASGFLPTGWLPVAGASVMGAALSAGAFMLPQRGQLLIDVSNQSWASLGNVQIFVDGELVCTQSPCAVKLDAESHSVKAVAPGYQSSQEESVLITDDSVTLHKIQLGASADTGIDVQTSIPNLQLYIDGRRVGSLPRKVTGLPPGEHTIVVSGGEHFTSEERRVVVEPNQVLAVSDLTPKLKAGSLEVSLGANADGATVLLDGKHIALPYRAQVTPGQTYRLTAKRDGYDAFEKTFTVDANTPSANFDINLIPSTGSEPGLDADAPARSRHSWVRARSAASMTRAEAVAKALADESASHDNTTPVHAESASNGVLGAAMRQSVGLPAEAPEATDTKATSKGFLNIVTSPSALVVIDGKPMGKTPRRVAVSAGTHSVVLVHANGRKRTSVDVDAGGTKTIKASF